MRKRLIRSIVLLLVCAQLAACGLLLYPERKGRSGGRIDPTVAILDGVGCLFFLIPGLVAFAVDFHHGTIYLPSGSGPKLLRGAAADGWTTVDVDPDALDADSIAATVSQHSGQAVDLADPRWDVLRAERIDDFRGLGLHSGS